MVCIATPATDSPPKPIRHYGPLPIRGHMPARRTQATRVINRVPIVHKRPYSLRDQVGSHPHRNSEIILTACIFPVHRHSASQSRTPFFIAQVGEDDISVGIMLRHLNSQQTSIGHQFPLPHKSNHRMLLVRTPTAGQKNSTGSIGPRPPMMPSWSWSSNSPQSLWLQLWNEHKATARANKSFLMTIRLKERYECQSKHL